MIDYKKIVSKIWDGYGDKLNDWETGFIDNMVNRKSFSTTEEEKILEINRKYRVMR